MCLGSETNVWLYVSDSGVGAGIDSYYEYLLKAYILLGDDMFLQRFNIVSNLISPCLHNSVCYFSSLTHRVFQSLPLRILLCLFEIIKNSEITSDVLTKLLRGCWIHVV